MNASLAIATKETRDILRERSIVVALLVQLFIAGFSTSLSIGLSGLYDPGSVGRYPAADIAFEGSPELAATLSRARNVRVLAMDGAAGLAAFQVGDVDAVIVESGNGTRSVSLLLADGGIQSTLILTQMRDILQGYELQLRRSHQADLANPVLSVDIPSGRSFPYGFVYATLLPLLVFTPVVLSGAIAGDSLVQEMQGRTITLLRSGPVSVRQILAGKLLAPVLLAPMQVLLWIGLFALNGIAVAHVGYLLLIATLGAVLLASLAAAVGTSVPRPSQAQAAYALTAIFVVAVSLLMPRNPMNLVARLATGTPDLATWLSLAIVGLATAAAAWVGWWVATRSLARTA